MKLQTTRSENVISVSYKNQTVEIINLGEQINIILHNASHKKSQGKGRFFNDYAEALSYYKSSFMKAAISKAESLNSERLNYESSEDKKKITVTNLEVYEASEFSSCRRVDATITNIAGRSIDVSLDIKDDNKIYRRKESDYDFYDHAFKASFLDPFNDEGREIVELVGPDEPLSFFKFVNENDKRATDLIHDVLDEALSDYCKNNNDLTSADFMKDEIAIIKAEVLEAKNKITITNLEFHEDWEDAGRAVEATAINSDGEKIHVFEWVGYENKVERSESNMSMYFDDYFTSTFLDCYSDYDKEEILELIHDALDESLSNFFEKNNDLIPERTLCDIEYDRSTYAGINIYGDVPSRFFDVKISEFEERIELLKKEGYDIESKDCLVSKSDAYSVKKGDRTKIFGSLELFHSTYFDEKGKIALKW